MYCCGIERRKKHGLARLGLEVIFTETLNALVQLVKASYLRLLVEETDDRAKGQPEEAEEDVDEVLVRFCKQHLSLLLVDEQLHGDRWPAVLRHGR